MKTKIKTRIAAAGLVATAIVGSLAVGANPASAQTATTTTAAKSATSHSDARAADLNDLASRLGVSVEKIQTAEKEQAKADVDKALAAGTITAAQATTLKTAIDQGIGGKHGLRVPRSSSTTRPTDAERQAAATAREADLAARIGVTADALKAARTAHAKARIDAQVTAGRITAEQAATLKTAIDQGLVGGHGFGGHGGGRGGHGGFGGHGGPAGRGR